MPSKQTRRKARHDGTEFVTRRGRRQGARAPFLLAQLGGVLEKMELRTHFSVSTDVNGYTVVTPSADSKVIYVSATGSDSNAGTSPSSAVQTIAEARLLLAGRNNMPDEILLRRGDVFNTPITNWTVSGRSASEPFVIGAYTDPARPSTARPQINSGNSSGFTNSQTTSNHTAINYLDILGVSFQANNRNYRQPNANFSVNYKDDIVGGTYGINVLGAANTLLVEDCSFQYYRTGLSVQAYSPFGTPTNFELRRCDVIDNYAPSFSSSGGYITSEGIYADGVVGLTLDGNIFDHNGWMDPAYGNFGCFPTIYNHDAYIQTTNVNFVATGNIFADASSHGLQARAGGIVTNNLFIDDPIAMSYGYVNGHETPGGVYGVISGNVIYGSRDISGSPRGWGLEIGNLRSAADGGGTIVENNIYSSYAAQGQPAIQLSFGANNTNPLQGVGINDLTLQDNIVYGWTEGIYINSGFVEGGTGRKAFNNVSFLNNEFQQVYATPIVQHGTAYSAAAETWRGNRYSIQGTATNTTKYFQTPTGPMTLAQWEQTIEPTASIPSVAYPNPNNSPATYDSTVAGPGTLADFIAQARQLSSQYYRAQFTATPAANYIKSGFSGQRIDTQPPSGTLTANDITVAGGAAATFTVTWKDDNQVNFSTIGNSDVQVTGPNGYSQPASLVTASANGDGSVVTAVYTVPAANGAWAFGANGGYTVSAVLGQVTDKSGNPVPAGPVGSFNVNIAPTAPAAKLVATNVSQPTAPAILTVTYTVAGGSISAATLDSNDLLVTGPNGFQTTATFEGETPSTDGSPVIGTYQIDPPADGWSEAANGVYTVSAQSGQITSSIGTPIGSTILGTFTVNVSVPAAAATAPTIVNGTASSDEIVTVKYQASAGINPTTIGAANIAVDGPNGYYADSTSGLTLVGFTGTGKAGNPLIATYDVPVPPTGSFGESYDGTFTITLLANQVSDLNGTPANGGPIGTFDVNVDMSAPAAVTTTPSIFKTTTANSLPVAVVYSDRSGVNTSSLGSANISVYNPDGTQAAVTYQGYTGSGNSVTATYVVSTPGGLTAANNGSYSVFVNSGEVSDSIGNVSTGSYAGLFVVNIGTAPPTATAFTDSPSITDPTISPQIYVNYADSPGIDQTTLDSSDLRVVGPNGYNQPVTLLSVDSPDGSSASVVYQLAAPAGGWQTTNNGDYSIVVQPNQVYDLSGNVMPTQTLVTFNVNVAQTVSATIRPVTPNPASPGLDQLTIQFSQQVSNFATGALSLTKDGGPNLFDGTQTLTSSDGITYVLGNLAALTTQSGQYTLTLTAANSGITGQQGGLLGANATTTFAVDATPPVPTATAPDITAPGTQPQVITVTYTDNNLVNAATINTGNISVTAPNGTIQVAKLMSVDSGTSGPVRVATYSITAPAGGWATASDGSYTVNMVDGQVSDVNGNYIPAGSITAFKVNITGADTQPPVVTGSALDITTAGTQPETFSVTYTDGSAVKASTIASGNVTVTAPNGTTQLATLVSVDSSLDGPVRVAIYSIPAPTGGWSSTSNGAYAVNLRSGQVSDVYGNFAPGQFITSFNVNAPAAPDTHGPVPTGSALDITSAGTQAETFTVTYTDATAVKVSTIVSGNVLASGPNGYSQNATLLNVDSTANGPVRVATYSVPAPAGGWTAAYNGTYAVRMRANQVSDTLGNYAFVQFITAFNVNTPPKVASISPNPVIGSTSAQNLTIAGSNFASNATVILRNLTAGTATTPNIVSQSSTQIVVSNVFGVTAGSWTAEVTNGSIPSGQASFSVVAPSTTLGITISPSPVTGKTAALTAINGGSNTGTTYKWAATKLPSGATAPTFSANSTNAAQKSTITFSKAGSYTLTLTSTTGSTVKTATVTFTVNQTVSSVTLSITAVTLANGKTQQFTATAKDQFGAVMAPQPAFAWSIAIGGVGTVSTSGLYTAPAAGSGLATVKAAAAGISASAIVTVAPVKINFQPASAPTVSGYLVDGGATFANHAGLSYGWTISETDSAVDRNKNSNQLLDTNIAIKTGAKWEIGLANGTYTVTFSVGDSSVATTNTIRLQGATQLNAVKPAANAFSSKTATVTVVNGLLTLDAGSAANLATRIDDIQIIRVS